MLKSLKLEGVGPAPGLTAEFGDRLNVITGDNGLGKSFLLDVCFWSLTGTWPGGRTAMPIPNGKKSTATITYEIKAQGSTKKEAKTAKYDFASQTWIRPKGRPLKPGLVIYASVDGGFAVWDPARNYWRDPATGIRQGDEEPRAYQFTPETLANGLRNGESVICSGLIQDWVNWYYESASFVDDFTSAPPGFPFKYLQQAVNILSHPSEKLSCIEPKRVFIDEPRKYPVLSTPYDEIAYPQWSAGVRRIVSLAYLVAWTWHEHVSESLLRRELPTKRLILLVDEIESHLHPKWQRVILPALIKVFGTLAGEVEIQVVAATHSPLVLASLETSFDAKRDKLFWFDLQGNDVEFHDYPWTPQGDVVGWLTSEIFGLKQARSTEAETAIEAAEAFMRGDVTLLPDGMKTKGAIHKALLASLPGMDPFWPRWIVETKR